MTALKILGHGTEVTVLEPLPVHRMQLERDDTRRLSSLRIEIATLTESCPTGVTTEYSPMASAASV